MWCTKYQEHCWKFQGTAQDSSFNCINGLTFVIPAACPMYGQDLGVGFVYFDRQGWPGVTHDANSYECGPLPELLKHGRSDPEHQTRESEYALVDLGYQSCTLTVSQHKRSSHQTFSIDQKIFNEAVNSARAKIENAFSRTKNLFQVMQGPYRGDINDCHDIAFVCANLTNLSIKYAPLCKRGAP